MEIQINNHPIEFQLQQEMTIADVINSINGWSSERDLIFSEVHIDGEPYTVDDIPLHDLEKIACINCIIQSKSDIVFSSIDEGARYCARAGAFIDSLLEDTEKVEQGQLEHLSQGLEWMNDVFKSIVKLTGLDANAFGYKNRTVADYILFLEKMKNEVRDMDAIEEYKNYFQKHGNIFPILKEIFRLILMSPEMKKLILHSIDSPDVVLETLTVIRQSMPKELQNIEDIAVSFQTGKDKEGIEKLNQFIDFVFNYIRTCYQVMPVFDIELTEFVHDGVNLGEKNERLQQMLQETIAIMENNDFISLSDILEYEIKPSLEDLDVYLGELINAVNER